MRIILTQDEIIEACETWLKSRGYSIDASQLLEADDHAELSIEIELSAEMVEPLKA